MRRFIAAVFGISILQTAYRGGQAVLGEQTNYFYDAAEAWIPLAQAVLNGAPLYGPQIATDNKPWLFQYVNLAAMASGAYPFVMFALVAIANALAAVFLHRWLTRETDFEEAACITAAFLFLLSLPLITGTAINVRSPALALFFLALLTRSGIVAGIAMTAAALFSQYIVFGGPLILWQWHRDNALQHRLPRAVFGAFGTLVISLIPLWIIWGEVAVWNAINASIFEASGYTNRAHSAILDNPARYASSIGQSVIRTLFVLVPAFAFTLGTARNGEWLEWPQNFLLTGTIVLSVPLLIKPLPYYWMLPMPWLATLAAVGVHEYLNE